jgi:hypothetical protein
MRNASWGVALFVMVVFIGFLWAAGELVASSGLATKSS